MYGDMKTYADICVKTSRKYAYDDFDLMVYTVSNKLICAFTSRRIEDFMQTLHLQKNANNTIVGGQNPILLAGVFGILLQ